MDNNIVGLTEKEVIENRKKYGSNNLTKKKKDSFLKLFIEALGDPMIKILLVALGIKTIFLIKDFDWYETVGIVIAILIASLISTISEYGSEKAFEKLQEESSKIKCRVKRDGIIKEINIEEVVTNDIVVLSSGDRIPADGIIIDGELSVDESSINGETKEQYKYAVKDMKSKPGRKNIVFRGTVVYSKEALMLVEKVGENTFYGNLAKEIQEKQPDSPLKIRLSKLASLISKIGYVASFLVAFSYLFSEIIIDNKFNIKLIMETVTNFPLLLKYILHALTLAVTIIVVCVPEGLPMMITLVLSSNMKRMLKNNVLVRKLVGIETAGNINILFTDKTGTLTKGKLEVVEFLSGNLKSYKSEDDLKKDKVLHEIVKTSFIYNNASNYGANNEVLGGNITDRALLEFIKTTPKKVKKISSIPFDSKYKYSITTIDDGKRINLIKGAPEVLLEHVNGFYDENGKKKVLLNKELLRKKIKENTNNGIRVLLLATSEISFNPTNFHNLTLVGLVCIKDEVRKEAIEGLELVQNASIQTVMITGDNKDTALAIGKEAGLIKSQKDLVITSEELNKMSDEEVKKIIPNLKIVARSLPQDKSRLVKIAEELDYVVGMTGDGVNDAPALKKANVGFAMGSGTEVSKEAADIVILDDNFLSIAKAILYGRTIFKSIRKFIIFQLTVNLCAVCLSIIGPFIGVETPVTVIQMLWINMVMDTLAGLAFSFEPPLKEYMNEKPKGKNESIINAYMIHEILFTGLYSALLCILFLKLPFFNNFFRPDPNNSYFMTAFFGLFIFIAIFNSFNARTHRINLLSNITKNKIFIYIIIFIAIIQMILIYYGGELFRTSGLTITEFLIMLLLSFSVIPVDWIRKLYLRKKGIKIGV